MHHACMYEKVEVTVHILYAATRLIWLLPQTGCTHARAHIEYQILMLMYIVPLRLVLLGVS